MRNIVIVEAGSTGFNFIRDIVSRNYYPIVLDMKKGEDAEDYKELIWGSYEKIEDDFGLIHEKDSYEETLEMVREYDPLLVIPGSELGVRLATQLAYDLNLKGNSIENLDAMTLKDKMQERIAEAGLRHIRGRVVKSVEEAIEYYDEEGLGEVVVKPIMSAGSVGVRICLNKEEMINSLNQLFNELSLYGEELSEFVIQERIKGEEYIVNTVSCNGDHRVTLMWKYTKVKTEEGGNVYDSVESVNELGLGEAELVEYAYDVVDALGIEYGAVHGEYMIDENGPVLIEVNCRPSGGSLDAEYLDRISGQHETDSILDSYLNPENFYYEMNRGYKLYAHGCFKMFIVPRDLVAKSSPMKFISNKLKSHYKTSQDYIGEKRLFVKTQDVETTGGIVYLVHEDGYVVHQDLEFLHSIERSAFDLILSEGHEKKTIVEEDLSSLEELKSIVTKVKTRGSTLFVTDQKIGDANILEVSLDEIEDIKGDFNSVVINLNESIVNLEEDMIAYKFLKIIEHVKKGGIIIIPESTYQYTPHGRSGAEALVKVLDLKIELPLYKFKKMVIASKN